MCARVASGDGMMIPNVLEAAPVVPALTFPHSPIYPISNCSSGLSMLMGRSVSDIYLEQASKEFAAHIDNQILQDILNH